MYLVLNNLRFDVLNNNKELMGSFATYEDLANSGAFDDLSNLEEALDALFENQHKVAIFGVNKQFMFTKLTA